MKPNRTATGKKRRNLTPHRRAVADKGVSTLINKLRREWKKIGPIERGERLRVLASHGCSTRGLEQELGQSATSIRRHMTLAALPDQEREAVRIGGSAKKVLARKAQADRLSKMRARVATESRTGEWSDRVADTILAFCQTVKNVPSAPIAEEVLRFFLGEVRRELSELEADGVQPLRLPKRLTLRQRFVLTRPPVDEGIQLIAHQAKWLANLLLAEAPEGPIREGALEKAGRRGSELRITLTPMQALQQRLVRQAGILAGPPRRRY